jgi:hypothetical protein
VYLSVVDVRDPRSRPATLVTHGQLFLRTAQYRAFHVLDAVGPKRKSSQRTVLDLLCNLRVGYFSHHAQLSPRASPRSQAVADGPRRSLVLYVDGKPPELRGQDLAG